MTRTLHLAVASALLGACSGILIEPSSECAVVCQRALDCGLLPSALGTGATTEAALADCERLCSQSPADDADTVAVIDCLTASNDRLVWCTDETADNYAAVDGCAATVACFDGSTLGASVLGAVELEVSLISIPAFTGGYGDEGLSALYDDTQPSQTCAWALCDSAACKFSHGDPEIEATLACDASLCGVGSVLSGAACESVVVTAIEIYAVQAGGFAVNQSIEGATDTCDTAAVTFTADTYGLRPGPVVVYAQVSGSLAAGDLRSIGYEVAADVEDDELVDYCLAFPGMNVLLRSGTSRAVIPVGGVAELMAYGLTPTACHS